MKPRTARLARAASNALASRARTRTDRRATRLQPATSGPGFLATSLTSTDGTATDGTEAHPPHSRTVQTPPEHAPLAPSPDPHRVLLGHTGDDQPVHWVPQASPGLLISGAAGSGKTVLTWALAAHADAHPEVEADFLALDRMPQAQARHALAGALAEARLDVEARYRAIHLDGAKRNSEMSAPAPLRLLVLDALPHVLVSGDQDAVKTNGQIWDDLLKVARSSRTTDVHLVVTTQVFGHIPASLRNPLKTRAMTGTPTPGRVKEMFGAQALDDQDIAWESESPYGLVHADLSGTGDTVASFRAAYFEDHVPVASTPIAVIGAPEPEVEQSVDPVAEQFVDPVAEFVAEESTEPVTEPVEESVADEPAEPGTAVVAETEEPTGAESQAEEAAQVEPEDERPAKTEEQDQDQEPVAADSAQEPVDRPTDLDEPATTGENSTVAAALPAPEADIPVAEDTTEAVVETDSMHTPSPAAPTMRRKVLYYGAFLPAALLQIWKLMLAADRDPLFVAPLVGFLLILAVLAFTSPAPRPRT